MSDTLDPGVFKLDEKQLKLIKEQQKRLPDLKKGLEALKAMGQDTTDLEEKLSWIENVTASMEKLFAKKGS